MAQTKVGKLLLEMFDRKINTVHGVKHMAGLLHMDSRVFMKYAGFLVHSDNGSKKMHLHLDSDQMEVIKRTKAVFAELASLTPSERRIAQFVFMTLEREWRQS